MNSFKKQLPEAQQMIDKLNSIKKERKQLSKDIKRMELDIESDDESDREMDDEDEQSTEQLKEKLIEKREQLKTLNQELHKLERDLLRFSCYGEVRSILPKNSATTEKCLKDYEYIKDVGGRLGNNVKLYKNNHGELVILKKFFTDEKESGALQRELSIVDFKHPLILPVNHIFYDKGVAYVETPYIEGGTLRDWLANGKAKTSVEIQNMFRLIVQGIDVLHNRGIIHCDLKPENILIRVNNYDETCIPVICDFEMSRNKNISSGVSTTRGGTVMYMSPERHNRGCKPSTRADVWSLGIILLEMISYPLDISGHVATNQHQIASLLNVQQWNSDLQPDASLYELLTKMLQVDVKQRFETVDVLHHAFLNKALFKNENNSSMGNQSDGTSKKKTDSLLQMKFFIAQKSRETFEQCVGYRVNPQQNFVQGALDSFYSMTPDDLTKQLVVQFDGEDGIDGGALTTSLYTRLFQSVSSPNSHASLLQALDVESNLFIVALDALSKVETQGKQYEALGKALIKMIYDQRTIPLSLAPYLMRYLICSDEQVEQFDQQMLTLSDMEMVDQVFGRSLRWLLSMNMVHDEGFYFSDLDENDDRVVNNHNKKEYIQRTIAKRLFTDRQNNMKAMRRGFRCIHDLIPFINSLHETDLAILISEQRFIDRHLLVDKCIHVTDHNDKELCRQVLLSMSDQELKLLLFFATGQVGMFNGGHREPLWNPNNGSPYPRSCITFRMYRADNEHTLPVAHVCFYCIDMPRYDSSPEKMKQKLIQAISNSDATFQLA